MTSRHLPSSLGPMILGLVSLAVNPRLATGDPDSTPAGAARPEAKIRATAELSDAFRLVRALELRAETHHVQGLEVEAEPTPSPTPEPPNAPEEGKPERAEVEGGAKVDGDAPATAPSAGRLWVSSVDRPGAAGYLFLFDLATGEALRQERVEDGARIHPGGIAADPDGVTLWVPVAEYRPRSTSWVERRRKDDLSLVERFEVADHVGCVAATSEAIVCANWDAREFLVFDRSGAPLRRIENPHASRYQDIKFQHGRIVGAGGGPKGPPRPDAPGEEPRRGRIDVLAFGIEGQGELALQRRILVGETDRGVSFTQEGMDLEESRLWLLPEDGPSRLFEFEAIGRR